MRDSPVSAIFTNFVPREPHLSRKQASPGPLKDLSSSLCGSRHFVGKSTISSVGTSSSVHQVATV